MHNEHFKVNNNISTCDSAALLEWCRLGPSCAHHGACCAAPLSPYLRKSWVDQLAVVELRRRSFIWLGQRQVEADGRLHLLGLGIASFRVTKQTSATSWPDRRGTSTSIFPKSDVDGLIFAAALLAGLRGRRRGVEGRDGNERHFPRLCHLTLRPTTGHAKPGSVALLWAAAGRKAKPGDGRQVQLARCSAS